MCGKEWYQRSIVPVRCTDVNCLDMKQSLFWTDLLEMKLVILMKRKLWCSVIWSYNIQSIISFLEFLWFCRFRCANGSLAKSCGKPQVLGRVDHGGEWLVCFFKGGDFFFLVSKLCHEKWTLLWFVIFLKLIETLVLLVYKRLKVCAIDFGLRGLGFAPGRVISVPCRGGGWVGERNRDKLRLERPLAKPSLSFFLKRGR